jgi:hypothetical protein
MHSLDELIADTFYESHPTTEIVVIRNAVSEEPSTLENNSTVPANNGVQVIAIQASTNYIHRGELLKDFNLLEYCILVQKEKKPPTRETHTHGRRRNFRCDFASITYSDNPNEVVNHPQYRTHEQQLTSKVRIPLLSGERVPKYPDKNLHQSNETQYNKSVLDFCTYFMTLLIPWDLNTSRCKYPISMNGLIQWKEQRDIPPEGQSLHLARLRYLENCIIVGQTNKIHDTIMGKFRDQSSDTKEKYLELERLGARGGRDPSGESLVETEDNTYY